MRIRSLCGGKLVHSHTEQIEEGAGRAGKKKCIRDKHTVEKTAAVSSLSEVTVAQIFDVTAKHQRQVM